jgi:lipoprotein-anchoring transpeptidase ErfK/SrfK
MADPETSHPQSRSRVRAVVAAVVVLVAIVPIVVGLLLSGGGGNATVGGAASTSAASKPFVPVVATKASRPPRRRLPAGSGALVAELRHGTQMRSAPGGGRVLAKVGTRTEFGTARTFWVQRRSGSWLGVASNLAGNNRVGWIPASAASLSRVNWEIRASLSTRQLTVLHNGRPVERYSIAVGAPAAPTPTGRFAVTDRLTTGNPGGPYGCCILALSALAPHAIQDWSGGNRIAIHSTPETDSIGKPVSHGCMRLTLAEGRWLLAHIPLGTPTLVST